MSKKALSRLHRILAGALADGSEPVLEPGGTRLEHFAHFWVLVWRSFVRNRCPVRAAALSYTTLLALIPMLAVAMSVTSSLLKSEGEQRIEQFVQKLSDSLMPPATATDLDWFPEFDEANPIETTPPGPTNVNRAPMLANSAAATNPPTSVITSSGETNAPALAAGDARVAAAQKAAARHIHDFIQNTRSGTLGATGMVFLIFVAISMLSRVEATFNDIWGVTRGRNWLVRVVQYWAAITLGPLLIICALGLAGGPHLQATRTLIGRMPFIGTFIFNLLPVLLLWLTFALLYKLGPNTNVRFKAALVGGILAGSLWHLNNMVGFLYVSRVVTNSKIYGSLGLVPVFMAGLYFSWLILLFGAQITYAFQNRESYLQEKLAENVNQRGREFVALRLMTCIGQRFQRGLPPVTLPEISGELGIPTQLIEQVLETLVLARLVVEVSADEAAYAPARPLETINCHHILLAMRALQGQELVTRDEPVRAEVYGEFARIQAAEKEAASRVTMLALVNRAPAGRQLAPLAAERALDGPRPLETVTELPNEPVLTTETPPPAATATVEINPAAAATMAETRTDKDVEPIRPPAEPPADDDDDDERNFPL
jgi:membrane protein